MRDENLKLGDLTIRTGSEESYENKTCRKIRLTGRITHYHLEGNGVDLILGYAEFINGERDIRTVAVNEDFETFGRLRQGLRLCLMPVPDTPRMLYAELQQAWPTERFSSHQTLHPVTSESDLDEGAGLPVFPELRRVGAEVGTRGQHLGEATSNPENLCLSFRTENMWAPVVAYVATRVLPIARGYKGA